MSVISGEELRQIRENADRTVEQFAHALGLSVEDYLDLEAGRVALTDAQERRAYDAWDDSAEEGGYLFIVRRSRPRKAGVRILPHRQKPRAAIEPHGASSLCPSSRETISGSPTPESLPPSSSQADVAS